MIDASGFPCSSPGDCWAKGCDRKRFSSAALSKKKKEEYILSPGPAEGVSLQRLWVFFFWFLLGVLCIWRVLVLPVSLLCARLGLLRCASYWTRPSGGGRRGHYLCNLWEEYLKIHKTAYKFLGIYVGFMIWEPFLLASAGQPSLHGYYACMVYWTKGHSGEIAAKSMMRPHFLLIGFFCLVEILLNDSGDKISCIFGPGGQHILVHRPSSVMLALSFIMLVAGLLMVILLLMLGLLFLLLLSIG